MPAGSAAALICDTGALIDYLVESAPDHRLFRNAIDQARTRYVPGLVLAEVDYFLRDERGAMQVFMQDLARGAFTYAPPLQALFATRPLDPIADGLPILGAGLALMLVLEAEKGIRRVIAGRPGPSGSGVRPPAND